MQAFSDLLNTWLSECFLSSIKLLLKAATLDLTAILNDLFIYIIKRKHKTKIKRKFSADFNFMESALLYRTLEKIHTILLSNCGFDQ